MSVQRPEPSCSQLWEVSLLRPALNSPQTAWVLLGIQSFHELANKDFQEHLLIPASTMHSAAMAQPAVGLYILKWPGGLCVILQKWAMWDLHGSGRSLGKLG